MRIAAIGALCLMALGGCASSEPGTTPVHAPTPVADNEPPPAPAPAPDQCGAKEAQKYVGRPKTEIPVPLIPDWQRVACTTCPVTLEFMPKRLNFFYDADTGIVKEVRCG